MTYQRIENQQAKILKFRIRNKSNNKNTDNQYVKKAFENSYQQNPKVLSNQIGSASIGSNSNRHK